MSPPGGTRSWRVPGGGFGLGPGGPLRRLVIFLLRYAGALLFLFLTFCIGVFVFVVLTVALFFGFSLIPILVGIPILALTAVGWTLLARLERWRIRLLLGARIPFPYRRAEPGSSRLVRLRTRLLDPALWRDLVYVLLLLPVGVVQLVVVSVAFSLPWDMISYPLWFDLPEGGRGALPGFALQIGNTISASGSGDGAASNSIIQFGPWVVDTPLEIVLTFLLGLVLAVAGFFLVRLTTRLHLALAFTLLGAGPLRRPRLPRLTRRAALISVATALVILLVALYFRGGLPTDQIAALWQAISSPERVREFFEGFGLWGPALFFALQAAQVIVALIPAAPIMVAGVATYGPWAGFALSLFGAVLGSVVAFYMGRRFGKPMVAKLVGEQIVDKYSGKMSPNGLWMLIALMLPIPAGGDAVCSLAGLSEMSPGRFLVLNTLGRAPYTALAVMAASGLATGSTSLLVGGAVALGLLGVVAFFYVRREKRREKQSSEPVQ